MQLDSRSSDRFHPSFLRSSLSFVPLLLVPFLIPKAGWSQQSTPATSPAAADFDALVRAARERFVPPDEKQLAAAKAELVQRANELERFLRPQTANGRRWLSYLQWQAFRQQLAATARPDLGPIIETYQRLNRNEVGLEMPRFRRTSEALRRYIDLLSIAGAQDPTAFYGRQLDALAADLRRLRERNASPSAEAPAAPLDYDIGTRLDFLVGIGQAPELVAAIRREFGAPNAFLNMSDELVRAAAEEPIDRRDPVTDNILGTSINGRGHTTGFVLARTVPSNDRATIELRSKGHVESQNTGRNGPAVIRTTGHTDFTATKEIHFTDKEFRAPPAKVNATTRSDIHSVSKAGGGIGSRIIQNQGMSRARQNQGRANQIAADHAEDRIGRRINEEVDKKLRDARKRYDDQYRHPLARRGEVPEDIRFASTEDAVLITATQANRGQLGAAGAPPTLPDDLDMVLRLHDSAVNNYSAAVLGGATASETEPGQDGAKFDVELPKWMKEAWEKKDSGPATTDAAAEQFKPWSLTFRADRPLTVVFANDKVSLTTHIARMTSGDEVYENWDVTGIFMPQIENGGVVLRRDGELVVLPTGFDRSRSLTASEVALRGNITKVLNERSAQGRGFPSRIEFGQIEPTGQLEKVGPLEARQLKSNGGWLTLAWHRKSDEG
jgi:hypothetical protein